MSVQHKKYKHKGVYITECNIVKLIMIQLINYKTN